MRERAADERGALTALVALLITLVVLPLGAVVVDIGFWYTAGKRAQTTADAAALAGAARIPNGFGAIDAEARRYALQNMPAATVLRVEWPNVGGVSPDTEVEVELQSPAPTFFGRVFGALGITTTRRAVAERTGQPGNLAVFAHSDDCSPTGTGSLLVRGDDVYVNGLVHSNGLFRVESDFVWAAEATIYRTVDSGCPSSIDENADPVQFGGNQPPPFLCGIPCRLPNDAVFNDWPHWWVPADFGWLDDCTEWGTTIEITSAVVKITNDRDSGVDRLIPFTDGVVPDGTYCARESFAIDGDDLTGRITGLGLDVSVRGNNHDFSPYANGVFLFRVPNTSLTSDDDGVGPVGEPITCETTATTDLRLGGAGNTWRGVVFNPCGAIEVNVGGGSPSMPALIGTLIGELVKINASGFHMVGLNDFSGSVETNLVE